ncbi:MAG: hypothetical protein GY737_31885 [Desulfobacteraceae bacterium]|nr:hypothetical protein [Desulfobacteraceae bacterium]
MVLISILSIQIIVYAIILRPLVTTWGASAFEVNMSLVGDDIAPYASSTRAISINAPASEVWKWLIQLGADRGGFFSYTFIEKALGYETGNSNKIVPEFQGMKVGRILESRDGVKGILKYRFPVVAVEPGRSFVLKEWGAFVLQAVNSNQTRLIIRTHGRELPSLVGRIGLFIGTPLHYIMERRMMMGIKARVEGGAGTRLSSTLDVLWFLGIVLSPMGIAAMVFIGRGVQRVLLPATYGIVWLWVFFVFPPQPIYGLILLVVIAGTGVWLHFRKKTIRFC